MTNPRVVISLASCCKILLQCVTKPQHEACSEALTRGLTSCHRSLLLWTPHHHSPSLTVSLASQFLSPNAVVAFTASSDAPRRIPRLAAPWWTSGASISPGPAARTRTRTALACPRCSKSARNHALPPTSAAHPLSRRAIELHCFSQLGFFKRADRFLSLNCWFHRVEDGMNVTINDEFGEQSAHPSAVWGTPLSAVKPTGGPTPQLEGFMWSQHIQVGQFKTNW